MSATTSSRAAAGFRPLAGAYAPTDIALYLIAALGIALRLRQYLFNRSLWLDEAMLAQSFVHRNLGSLLTQPLDHAQVAPPGFVIAAYGASALFGSSDWALRLVPLSAGLMTVGLAVLLARRELKTAAGRIVFVGLVALSPVLVYYASEFKQYSGDALFSLGLITALAFRNTRYGPWCVAIAGGLALASSLPSILVAAPAAILLIVEWTRARRWWALAGVGAAWGFEFAFHAAYILRTGGPPGWYFEFWSAAFAPFPPHTLNDLLWYPRAFSGLAYLAFQLSGAASPEPAPPGFGDFTTVLAVLSLVALLIGLASARRLAVVAAGTLVFALVAAMLVLYPFSTRLLIYFVPLLFFLIASGIDEVALVMQTPTGSGFGRARSIAAAGAAVFCLAAVAYPAALIALAPVNKFDIRGMLERIRPELGAGDGIAVGGWSQPQFDYYAPRMGLRGVTRFYLPREAKPDDLIEVIRKSHLRRVWFIEAFAQDRAEELIAEAAKVAAVTADWRGDEVRAVQFDLSEMPPVANPADPQTNMKEPAR